MILTVANMDGDAVMFQMGPPSKSGKGLSNSTFIVERQIS
jgi:hypothetical protein